MTYELNQYDCVEDIIDEALELYCGIKKYSIEAVFETDEHFVCGTINIVRRGKDHHHLIHKYHDGTWHEHEISESYEFAFYYKLSELEKLLPNLSMKNYNTGF